MDNKQISKEHQKIIKKDIEKSLKYREQRLKELQNDKNRIQNYQKKVKAYNEAKFKEYSEILEAIKNSSKDYYQYYKQYEKKHGWKKTTQLLEKRNFMKQWINFIIPIIKPPTLEESYPIERIPPDRITYPSKPSSPSQLPPGQIPKSLPSNQQRSLPSSQIPKSLPPGRIPKEFYDNFDPEEQYINEEKILENLVRDSAREYLSYRMLRAGFMEYDVERVLEMLSDSQVYQIVDEIQRKLPLDETSKRKLKSPPNDDYENDIDEATQSYEYVKIMDILNQYEVFL